MNSKVKANTNNESIIWFLTLNILIVLEITVYILPTTIGVSILIDTSYMPSGGG